MKGYAQFCPVAKAAEILDRRWTLLILRELHCGSHRFNEIHRGVPRMSRSLLARRMRELEVQGLIDHQRENEEHGEYRLTPAGEELGPVIMQLGAWGKRWIRSYVSRDDFDAGLLMWDVQRHVSPDSLPEKRIVTNFNFPDAPKDQRNFWLLLEPEYVDLCLVHPGYEEDLFITATLGTFIKLWLGDVTYRQAKSSKGIVVTGPPELCREFPRWLGLSPFAKIARQTEQYGS